MKVTDQDFGVTQQVFGIVGASNTWKYTEGMPVGGDYGKGSNC
jgi:hypothetical protein